MRESVSYTMQVESMLAVDVDIQGEPID
jgi:hypothetical protein